MAQSVATQGIKIFFVDLVGGLLGFPVWWYSKGLVRWVNGLKNFFAGYSSVLGVRVWVKNLFVPMYGSYDIGGRLISFFMRSVMIIIRSVGMMFLVVMTAILFAAYLILPIIVIGMVLYHGIGSVL
ncbi:hypothetical protein HQ524_03955 [Candidatus Uhrbacteria bacterium]|nr:hypothetical protein [Candidatus Uhrbacteria bacterium]